MNERLLSDLPVPHKSNSSSDVYLPCCSDRIYIFSRILHIANVAFSNYSAVDSQKRTFFGPGNADFIVILFSPLLFFFIIHKSFQGLDWYF